MANTGKPSADSHENKPLHRPSSGIDAGSSDDSDGTPIVKPSTDMHETKPGPGNEALGQVSKM